MKRREFLKSAAVAAVASGLTRSTAALPQSAGIRPFSAAEINESLPGASGSRRNSRELADAQDWFAKHFGHDAKTPPFSFVYDQQPSASFLASWPVKAEDKPLSETKLQRTILWTDTKTQLEARCVAVIYSDFPVVEWTIHLRNIGTNKTPLLENIEGLTARFEHDLGAPVLLHHHKGDSDIPESYQPFVEELAGDASAEFHPRGGRPTDTGFPYFNLQMRDRGTIIAIGWPGEWAATFKRDRSNAVEVSAGQQLTHLFLKPGEEIRSPLIALLFWRGDDTARAQNLWRRWMLACNLPRFGEKEATPIFCFCDGGFFPGLKVSEAGEKEFIDVLSREGIKIDYWWIDAGWYPCGEDWQNTGTWEPDPLRFPNGLKAVSDYLHAKGMKLIVWFEPERVTPGSWLATNHPDWLLGGKLLNLSRPEVREWNTNHIDRLITEQGIDLYRQDFNIDPLEFWRNNDEPDRQGMTENLYVQGYLAHFDTLRSQHPGMLIDSCSSGGRRNDLETMRRAVPLLRSDYQAFDGNPKFAIGNQGHTYGISSWLPYYGQGVYITKQDTAYYERSHMCPAMAMPVDVRKDHVDWETYRRLLAQWQSTAACMLGDYYPLTKYNLDPTQWIAWQFDRPENGDGIVQAFRREDGDQASMSLLLRGLDPTAHYEITDLDAGAPTTFTGSELLRKGLRVDIASKPRAALIQYRKKK